MCFITSILKFVSWIFNPFLVCRVPHSVMPTLLQRGLPLACFPQAPGLMAGPPQALVLCNVDGGGTDGEGGLLLLVCL